MAPRFPVGDIISQPWPPRRGKEVHGHLAPWDSRGGSIYHKDLAVQDYSSEERFKPQDGQDHPEEKEKRRGEER